MQTLDRVRLRTDRWMVKGEGWQAIEGGLLRSYKRGRKAAKRARKGRSTEDLHAWRKRVKDLWYQERLLAPICGPAVRGHAKDAHRLADVLGDDHDLAMLRCALMREPAPAPVDLDAVLRLIDHRRDQLQSEAFDIGTRVYAEAPAAFRQRMKRSWRAGRRQGRAPAQQDPAKLAEATRVPVAV